MAERLHVQVENSTTAFDALASFPGSVEQLTQRIEELERNLHRLRIEHKVFRSYVARVKPDALVDSEREVGNEQQEHEHTAPELSSPHGAGAADEEGTPGMSLDVKYEIASLDMEEVREEMNALRRSTAARVDSIQAEIRQRELRSAEIRRELLDLHRMIPSNAESIDPKSLVQYFTRYYEDLLKSRESTLQKLKRKNTALRSQIRKQEGQLRQKEDLGEALHVIDFDQLTIENQQYLEKIESKNNEMLRLKLTTGKTIQTLNSLKFQLSEITNENAWLQETLASKKAIMSKNLGDIETLEREAKRENRALERAKSANEDDSLPQILDYVALRAEENELEKALANWTRKCEIAKIELQSARAEKRRTARI